MSVVVSVLVGNGGPVRLLVRVVCGGCPRDHGRPELDPLYSKSIWARSPRLRAGLCSCGVLHGRPNMDDWWVEVRGQLGRNGYAFRSVIAQIRILLLLLLL